MKALTILIGFSLIAFISYLFFSGNIALAIIILMGSLIFLPIAIMAVKGRLSFNAVSHDSTSQHSGGGTSAGVGSSGDGGI